MRIGVADAMNRLGWLAGILGAELAHQHEAAERDRLLRILAAVIVHPRKSAASSIIFGKSTSAS